MKNKLFVGNLSWDIDNAKLEEIFSAAGSVTEAVVIMDRFKNRSRGFGFVTMSSEEEAQAAIEMLDGKDFMGRAINVSIAEERKDRNAN